MGLFFNQDLATLIAIALYIRQLARGSLSRFSFSMVEPAINLASFRMN